MLRRAELMCGLWSGRADGDLLADPQRVMPGSEGLSERRHRPRGAVVAGEGHKTRTAFADRGDHRPGVGLAERSPRPVRGAQDGLRDQRRPERVNRQMQATDHGMHRCIHDLPRSAARPPA